ncbi:putative chromatin-remodeling complex ATPase chain-like [Capsicum annuum]|nr:putative chromatin-remodeling complex ATPase chain-like [Capsicum annuum]
MPSKLDDDSEAHIKRGEALNTIQNWIADLFWKQLDIEYPGMENAMVHHGFYSAYHNTTLRPGVLSAVKRAKELYGHIPIMVTGHSMGGAMAAFCGLDLTVNYGSRNVSVMTFGQPRIGNAAFASYYSKWVPNTIRVTHEHDIVPHLPPYYHYFPQKTYHHFPTEVWLHNLGFGLLVYAVEKVCDNSGEDPSCSRQYNSARKNVEFPRRDRPGRSPFVMVFCLVENLLNFARVVGLFANSPKYSRSVTGYSIKNHLWYYGVRLGGENPGFCRIVERDLAAYGTVDVDGNVILSRDIPASVLRMNVEPNEDGRLM